MTAATSRIVTWNFERKKAGTPTGSAAIERVASISPDVIVATEARVGHFASLGGHEVWCQASPDGRYGDDERKVMAWSRQPWRDIDDVGHADMPAGRFIAATTDTPIGPIRVVGVCVPWHMCDVRTGTRDRTPWEQHARWLEAFRKLALDQSPAPVVIAGDFNQRVPRARGGRKDVAALLADVMAPFDIVTSGVPDGCERQGIDHIAIDSRLAAARVWGWPHNDGGVRMSDHDAVAADLVLR